MAQEKQTYKTIAEVSRLTPKQQVDYLKDQWGMADLQVRGRLTLERDIWWLSDVTDTKGRELIYPLSNQHTPGSLRVDRVFVTPVTAHDAEGLRSDVYVNSALKLASDKERHKRNNPLHIQAIPRSIRVLRHIPTDRIHQRQNGSIDLEETLCRGYVDEVCAESTAEIDRLQQQLNELKYETANAATQLHAKRHEAEQAESQLAEAQRALTDVQSEHQRLHEEMESGFAEKRETREHEARDHEIALEQSYEAQQQAFQQELDAIEQEVIVARKRRDREHDAIESQTAALRAFVKSRIEPLHRLELLSDAQWDALFPNTNDVTGDPERADWPEFDGDVSGAIEHVQRYLFGTGIGYPWDLLANFHTLLGTGDLLILSGLSGSGKTNLVKSYARATGNVAKIIPVKPNWTSAEDLIGYYNPLQRAYTSTPFLEALFEARRDPHRLHILCLDEMNLARVEYYFADFLSRLEDRVAPSIDLYPDDEAGHVLTELRLVLAALEGTALETTEAGLIHLLNDGPAMAQLAQRLGLADGESFPQLHARIRRTLSGALKVPSRLSIPSNVRFVGAVNIDDTTHYLSPKVLDRAHVLQFRSPLKDWERVRKEVGETSPPPHGVRIPAEVFSATGDYPGYDPEDPLVNDLQRYAESFLAPLGIDMGMRPLRQAALYRDRLGEIFEGDGLNHLALNNLFRQKALPRFSFDGKQRARTAGEKTCSDVVKELQRELADKLDQLSDSTPFSARDELNALVARAEANDGIFNYWA